MLKPLRKCKHPGCRQLVPGSYCANHQPKPQRKESASWHYLYTDPHYHWAERRTAQLLSEPFCRACARKGKRVRATDVDHVTPHRGDIKLFVDGNLQSLCRSCHSSKTMAEMNQRRRLGRL